MRLLVLLCVALLRSGATELCDTEGLCSCDRTWGTFNCSCTATDTKVQLSLCLTIHSPVVTIYTTRFNRAGIA
jgi:hypothetical protein